MPGISAKKGRFGCLIQAAGIKFKSGQKTLPILKMGGEVPFWLLAEHSSYLFAIKTRDLWSGVFVGVSVFTEKCHFCEV